jgi:two-component system, NarL family, response regulator LiaR
VPLTRVDKWRDDTMRVVVGDDSGLFRRRLIVGLEVEHDIEVAAECEDAADAIEVAKVLLPDVIFVNLQMAHIGGVRAAAGIREVAPACRVVIVLSPEDVGEAIRAVRAGAVGFLTRDDAVPRAALTAREVAAGRVVLPPAVAGQVLDEVQGWATATRDGALPVPEVDDRERRVLAELRDGQSWARLAEALGLPVATVHNLAAGVVAKVHRHARTEAVLYTVADRVYSA